MYTFNSSSFFPADRYGNDPLTCGKETHNSWFSVSFRVSLPRKNIQFVELETDLTAWLYVDGQLAIDLGGVHGTERHRLDLNQTGTTGRALLYRTKEPGHHTVHLTFDHHSFFIMDVFLAHRQNCSSHFALRVGLGQDLASPFAATLRTSAAENFTVGSTLLQINKPELDYTFHSVSNVTYSLEGVDVLLSPGVNISQANNFGISSDGNLSVARGLDYEAVKSFVLTARVQDVKSKTHVFVAIQVVILNVFDKGLRFERPEYTAPNVSNIASSGDIQLLSVTVIDEDSGSDVRQIHFSVKQPTFADYKFSSSLVSVSIKLTAQIEGPPIRSASVLVNVQGKQLCAGATYYVTTIGNGTAIIFASTKKFHVSKKDLCEPCPAGFRCPGDGKGYRCGCPVTNRTCGQSATEYSFGSSAVCKPCPEGWICEDGIASPCLDGQYADKCNKTHCQTKCLPCPLGYSCHNGVKGPCGPGYFAPYKGTPSCEPCPRFSFSNLTANTDCTCCSSGYQSSHGQSTCQQCNAHEWSPGEKDGSCSPCQTCSDHDICPCLQMPCFSDVQCININVHTDSASFRCLECPKGLTGNGINCIDIDECSTANPCSTMTQCINTFRGFHCTPCPKGYTGRTPHGFGSSEAVNNKQVCADINECLVANGGCDAQAACLNTIGSYSCGPCEPGYVGDGSSGCSPGDYCAIMKHKCDSRAKCAMTGAGLYQCKCNLGFAGTGEYCAEDKDLDGWPAETLQCRQATCIQDNCPGTPNSGQTNTDGDSQGDACDVDDDQDSWTDQTDNCPHVSNILQEDVDGDGVGDVCDNCYNVTNAEQTDSDGDGIGDACVEDPDGDGIWVNFSDNCPLISNPDQNDTDSDGVGDACDNCPSNRTVTIFTPGVTGDNDFDDVNDTCSVSSTDSDFDGIQDSFDNCPSVINCDQADGDADGQGDACDADADNDGIQNLLDNCPFVANVKQTDTKGNDIGDACRLDYDGDGTLDKSDPCPYSGAVSSGNFTTLVNISIPPNTATITWRISDLGATVTQIGQSSGPVILLAPVRFTDVEFSGTLFCDTLLDDDFIGIIFSFQSTKRFYVAHWKRTQERYLANTYYVSTPGWAITRTITGVYGAWIASDKLWYDSTKTPWQPRVAYRWKLTHRPANNIIRLEVFSAFRLIVDSGYVKDPSADRYRGGRLGLYSFLQSDIIWSDITYKCADKLDYALSFDGVNDFAHLPNILALKLSQSFTIELWLRPNQLMGSNQPLVCSPERAFCLFLDSDLTPQMTLYSVTVRSSIRLHQNSWNHLAVTLNVNSKRLSLLVNTTERGYSLRGFSYQGQERLYLGRDRDLNFFSGQIDELRFWSTPLSVAMLSTYQKKEVLSDSTALGYLTAHFTMDTEGSTSLIDDTQSALQALLYGSPIRRPSTLELPVLSRQKRQTHDQDDFAKILHTEL